MAFHGLQITEIFYSLQGETSLSGVPFIFIRLTGCNLRCTYCDSVYSFKGGTAMSFEDVFKRIEKFPVGHVLMTGGEPLLQRNTLAFIDQLNERGYSVSIETHGEVSIQEASKKARIIMDIKTPGSKMNRGGYEKNLAYVKPTDEIKFVITSMRDYEWARDMVQSWIRDEKMPTREILFSPALAAKGSPGAYEGVNPRELAERILEDQLPVRFQYQLHKLLWGADTKGV